MSEQVPKFLHRNKFYVLPTGNWSLWPGLNPRVAGIQAAVGQVCFGFPTFSTQMTKLFGSFMARPWETLFDPIGLGNCSLSRWNLNNMQIMKHVAAVYHVLDLFIIFFHDYLHYISV